jgi:hypothetical protein
MIKRLLSAELKVWHLLIVVAVFAVGTDTALARQATLQNGGLAAATSDSFFPSGTFNLAAAHSNTSQTVHSADGEVSFLQVAFTVPRGQVADIAAFFSGEAYKYANGYCYLKFYLDQIGGDALAPGKVWVADGYVYSGAYPTITAQGYRSNVRAGVHTLIVSLLTTGGDCYVDDRSIIVISNRHS